MSGSVPVVFDGQPGSGLPAIGLMGLDHTTDPFARILPAAARAPASVSFRTTIFDAEGIPGQGGPPVLDVDRYQALAGAYPGVPSIDRTADWIVLVSCGPFASLAPGQSVDLTMALVAAPSPDSIEPVLERTALMFIGTRLDTIPNETTHPDSVEFNLRKTGIAGHEVCLAAPPGYDLFYDPDCKHKLSAGELVFEDTPIHYPHDQCIWTDADCDQCTGLNGKETVLRWFEPAEVSPSPTTRVTPGDHKVTIEWDNTPEVLLGNQIGLPGSQFVGYRVYKLANWHNRQSLLPPEKNWALMGFYTSTSGNGETPLAAITDTTLDYLSILYERKLYPVGRYSVVDTDVLDGFDYVYVVTTVHTSLLDLGGGVQGRYLVETPLIAKFGDRVTPHTASAPSAGRVTVVPNPFRARADWDRGAVFGDPLPRHIDFMHLPRGRSTIKIYTLAGDFVAQIDHDASNGDGQVSWDLISRKGQDVESGIYLFTVDSSLGHQIGKFVLIR
jgi:hypothetical protein